MSTFARIDASVLSDWGAVLAAYGDDIDCDAPSLAVDDMAQTVDLCQFVAFLEKAGKSPGGPGRSWAAGIGAHYESRGCIGRAILGAPNLGVAFLRLSQNFALVQDVTSLRLDADERTATLSYKILDPDIWPRHEDAMYSLGAYAAFIRAAAPDVWGEAEITVEAEADYVNAELSSIVQAPVSYGGSSNMLRFPVRALDCGFPVSKPVKPADLTALSGQLAARRRTLPITARTRQIIYSEILEGAVCQDRVAREMGLSPRSLRRKLAEQGFSYQGLVDDCRMRLAALEFRARKDLSLSELALKLGYSEHSTFSRAFARWAGVPPQRYRRGMHEHMN